MNIVITLRNVALNRDCKISPMDDIEIREESGARLDIVSLRVKGDVEHLVYVRLNALMDLPQ